MEDLLHGMLGFFPIGEAVCSESDVVKLLVFQGASGGFGSSGLPESFFFLQDGDVEVRGDGHGAIVFFIDLAWRLVSSLSFAKGRESAPPGAFWAADFVGGAGRLPCQGNKDDGRCAPGGDVLRLNKACCLLGVLGGGFRLQFWARLLHLRRGGEWCAADWMRCGGP